MDFLGINYYCKEYTVFRGLIGAECDHYSHAEHKNKLNWNIYPQGLLEILLKLKKFNMPVFITENGTADSGDEHYREFLIGHLHSLARALSQGVPLGGYFWWSLLDNFEWERGFDYRFGLLEVDYKNMLRTAKPFSALYAKICGENRIDI